MGEIKLSQNLEALKTFGTKFFRDELFRPLPTVIADVKYNKNQLQIARRLDGSIYTLDLTEACRMLFVGATRCMPKGTLVKTENGDIPIEQCVGKKVSSWNFKKRRFEYKECKVVKSGLLKVVEVHMLGGGIYECSENHEWLVAKPNGKFKSVETKDLRMKDHLCSPRNRKDSRVAKVVMTDETKEMVDMTVEDNENFELADGTLTHNSGKTFFLRSIGDRLRQTEKDLVFINDCKNEFYSSIDPVQPKFEGGLLPGETPQGMNVVTLRPTFFKTVQPEKHPTNFWYSVDMRALSKADFSTMMNVTELSATQQVSMEIVFQVLQKRFEDDEELQFSVDLMNDIIDDIEELSTVQKTSLKFKFRPLENAHFFEKKHQRSVVELIKLGYVPAINMENFDSFGKGAFLFPEVTLNIVLREIVMARRRGEIRPLWVVMDEASRFIGKAKNGSLKESIIQSVDLDTRYNINYIFASQVVEDVPENVFKQSKYIFIPATADVSTIKYILVNTGNTKNIQTSVRDAMALKRRMKGIQYSWIVINRMDSTMELVRPLPPLSNQLETSN